MESYILEVAFSWSLFYAVYWFFLQKETFFSLNRAYLLGSLLLGLLLPLIDVQTSTRYLSELPAFVYGLPQELGQTLLPENLGFLGLINITSLLLGIYVLGFIIMFIKLVLSLNSIKQLIKEADIEQHSGYSIVHTNQTHSPFSFGNLLFISKSIKNDDKSLHYIIEHELTHIKQLHSFDILFAEILCIFFWFNPLVYFYKSALRDQHEYLADQAVLSTNSVKEYGQLLIEQSIPGLKLGLVNHLIYSQLKKRINMMTKKQSFRFPTLKYTSSLFAFMLVFWSVSCQKSIDKSKNEKSEISKVDNMPMFPAPDCSGDKEAIKKCAQQQLFTFIGENLKYPKEAKDKSTEGMTVIGFTVSETGELKDIKIVKELKNGCSEEAMRVVHLMNEKGLYWTPGTKEGKAVSVEMKLPFKFKLT